MAGKGQGGRKRKPTQLKVVAGTDRPDRINENAPQPSKALPVAPATMLGERGVAIFNGLTEVLDGMGIASSDHCYMQALLAMRLEEIEELTVMIQDFGRTYETTNQQGDSMHRSRPEVAQRNEAMRHAQSLMAEFGLSPAQIEKVSAGGKANGNPFSDL